MNRKKFILIGAVLIIVGIVIMIVLDDTDYINFIGGLVVGAGFGCLSVLFSRKKNKPLN